MDLAHQLLAQAVDAGFLCVTAFETDVTLTPLRTTEGWPRLMDRLNTKRSRVTTEFARAGGRALLA